MYLWRRLASQKWSQENEEAVRDFAGDGLAVIERPNHKRVQFEVATDRRAKLEKIAKRFGGRIERLPPGWLKRALHQKTKPVKVGTNQLIVPAGTAFGTGEHATTAMCLRMLERVMSVWGAQAPSPNARPVRFSGMVVDLGTGSGILALGARLLGARSVVGIDNDPVAISTARQNARLNNLRGVKFQVADVRRWKTPRHVEIVTANLFSELLVEVIPKFKRARSLILSGILRPQERDVRRALTGSAIHIFEVRRRGKWVAMLAGHK